MIDYDRISEKEILNPAVYTSDDYINWLRHHRTKQLEEQAEKERAENDIFDRRMVKYQRKV